jgi:hypothetical protein
MSRAPKTPDDKKLVRTRKATAVQQLVTVPQASEVKGVPERSIHDLIARGLLPYVQFPGGRRIWIDLRDFDALIAKSREVRA